VKLRCFGTFTLNTATGELLNAGKPVRTQGKPFELLVALIEKPGEVVTRQQLYARLWPGVSADYRRGLDTAMKKLRKALADDRGKYIQTLPRRGYRFVAPVTEIADLTVKGADPGMGSHLESYPKTPVKVDPDSEANRLYLQGYHCCNKRTPSAVKMALSFFERAHEREPLNAVYSAAIAHTYAMLATHGVLPPLDAIARARTAAMKALRIDGSQMLARSILAWARGCFDYDLNGAAQDFKAIIARDPDNPWSYIPYCLVLAALGRHDESRAALQKGHTLDPVSPTINTLCCFIPYLAHDFEEAIRLGEEAVARDPDFGLAHFYFAQALLVRAKHDQSIHHLRIANRIMDSSCEIHATLGLAYAVAGKRKESEQIDSELDRASESQYTDGYHRALLKWALGDRDAATRLIHQAADAHSQWFAFAAVDPKLDEIRKDPRVRRLLRRLKR
jgi:DNA-binding winged helix-turn-helix (wHTH) protein